MQRGLIIRFRLKIGSGDYQTPTYLPDKWKVNDASDAGEMYFRKKFSGGLTFNLTTYDAIHAAAFDTEFLLKIQEQRAGVWVDIDPQLRFYKTDCNFDHDARQVSVSPETLDKYAAILDGMNKEYNLIDLEPPTCTVLYKKQGIFQVYLPGAEYIMNFLDGFYWETPVSPFYTTQDTNGTTNSANHDAMLNDYGFGLGTTSGTRDYARLVIPGNDLNPDVSGVYKSTVYSVGGIATPFQYEREDGAYTIESYVSSPGNKRYKITRVSDSVIVYRSEEHVNAWWGVGQPPHKTPSITFTSETSATTCQAYGFYPYVRLLTTKTSIGGDATTELPTDDPFNKGSFTHALPIDTLNFTYSFASSTDATKYGKVSDDALYFGGQYFTRPTGQRYMPVLPNTWTAASAWFYLDSDLRDNQSEAGESVTLRHAYHVRDVISKLLDAIGSDATHTWGSTYSQFFYTGSNVIRGVGKYPIIAPKSNVINGDYEHPARKAPIRLSDVMQLLRNFHNVFWYVTSDGKLRLEHYQYFHNGNSYTGANVGTSVTGLQNPQASLPWSHGTNKWSYAKQELPERYEFGWMDDVSQPFEGYAIDILSRFVQKGKVEDKRIGRFTSDIDFLNAAPSTIATDGFVFFECFSNETTFEVPFVDVTVDGEDFRLQNGWASYFYAHDKYWRHGLPALDVKINNETTTALSVLRSRTQEILIPQIPDFDTYELVESGLGEGRIESSERNLESGFRVIKIRLDN